MPQQRSDTLETLFDALPDAVFLLSGGSGLLYANKAAQQVFPLAREKVLALPAVVSALAQLAQRPEPVNMEIQLPLQVPHHYSFTAIQLGAGAGEQLRIALIFHDVTELKRSIQLREDFVTNVSHELKTPLTSLLGFIETMKSHPAADVETRTRFLSIMEAQATRMKNLVHDLLSLARIEFDEHTQPANPTDLLYVVQQAMALLEAKAQENNVQMRVEAPANLRHVLGDMPQLMQMATNLIGNAISYTRPGTEVVAQLSEVDDGVKLEVLDQGAGIPPEHIPRVTERFYRVDPGRSRDSGGTGIGLAIVKHVVNRHRGELLITSTVGQGSSFAVIIPCVKKVS